MWVIFAVAAAFCLRKRFKKQFPEYLLKLPILPPYIEQNLYFVQLYVDIPRCDVIQWLKQFRTTVRSLDCIL